MACLTTRGILGILHIHLNVSSSEVLSSHLALAGLYSLQDHGQWLALPPDALANPFSVSLQLWSHSALSPALLSWWHTSLLESQRSLQSLMSGVSVGHSGPCSLPASGCMNQEIPVRWKSFSKLQLAIPVLSKIRLNFSSNSCLVWEQVDDFI